MATVSDRRAMTSFGKKILRPTRFSTPCTLQLAFALETRRKTINQRRPTREGNGLNIPYASNEVNSGNFSNSLGFSGTGGGGEDQTAPETVQQRTIERREVERDNS